MILIITKILIRQPRNETNIRRQITKQFIIHFVETDKKPIKKLCILDLITHSFYDYIILEILIPKQFI